MPIHRHRAPYTRGPIDLTKPPRWHFANSLARARARSEYRGRGGGVDCGVVEPERWTARMQPCSRAAADVRRNYNIIIIIMLYNNNNNTRPWIIIVIIVTKCIAYYYAVPAIELHLGKKYNFYFQFVRGCDDPRGLEFVSSQLRRCPH